MLLRLFDCLQSFQVEVVLDSVCQYYSCNILHQQRLRYPLLLERVFRFCQKFFLLMLIWILSNLIFIWLNNWLSRLRWFWIYAGKDVIERRLGLILLMRTWRIQSLNFSFFESWNIQVDQLWSGLEIHRDSNFLMVGGYCLYALFNCWSEQQEKHGREISFPNFVSFCRNWQVVWLVLLLRSVEEY